MSLPDGAQRHWHQCPSCAVVEATDPIRRSPFSLFLFTSLVWSLLEHDVYKKHCSVSDLVRPMMMKRTRRWHWLVSYRRVSLADLSRQTNMPFASALNNFLSSACLILHFCFVCSSATSESLWYFELVTYLRPHFCANDVYMVVGCIRM